jgi:ATP-binding cassette subfamily B protein
MKVSDQIISKSLLSFFEPNKLDELLNSAHKFEIKENKFFEHAFSNDRLLLCVEGFVTLIDKKLDKTYGKIIPGRSLELQSLFLNRDSSQFKWFSKTDSTFLSIDFTAFKELINKDELLYLYRISTKVELQNIKNSLRLFHVPEIYIRGLIQSIEEIDFSQTSTDIGFCIPIDEEIRVLFSLDELTPKKQIFNCQPGNLFIKHQIEGLEFASKPNRCWFITKEETDRISEEIFNAIEILDVIKDKIDEYKASNREELKDDEAEKEPDLDDGISIDSFYKEKVQNKIGRFKKLVTIQQHDMMDCGAACMSIISQHYGKMHPIAKWRNLIHITREGASMLALKRGGEKMGLVSIGVMSGTKSLQKFHTPFIALMEYHFVVIYSINDTHVTIADPGNGTLLTQSVEEFKRGFSQNVLLVQPTQEFFNQSDTQSTYWKYASLLNDHRGELLEIFIFCLIIFITQLTPPIFIQFIFDNALADGSKTALNSISAIAIIINLISGLMLISRSSMMVKLSTILNLKLSSLFFRRILCLPLNYFMLRNVGDITSRIEELESLRDFVSQKFISLLINVITLLTYAGILYLYNINLFLLLIFFIAGSFFPLSKLIKELMTTFREMFGLKSKMQSTLFELVKSMDTIVSLGGGSSALWKWYDRFTKYQKSEFSSKISISKMMVFNAFFQRFVNLTFLVLSVWLFTKGELTLGQVVAISTLINSIIEPILGIFQNWDDANRAFVSLEKIDDLLTCQAETDGNEGEGQLEFSPGDIEFDNVWFRYGSDASPWVLKGISLKVKAGETVAFVGLSGSGKSTITALINRLYEPIKGEVRIGGHKVQNYDLQSLRTNISMILQESSIFSASALENITLEKEFIFDKAKEASEMAMAHEFISKMKNGYSTLLGEDGETGMSGGQKQRLNIARTIYKNPPIIIMDEATSSLDGITERIVVKNIKNYCKNSTTFIIAHRLNTVLHADRIYVLDSGKIVEQGNHDTLLKQQGIYFQMFKKQVNL